MKLKTATLLGMIGAICSLCLSIYYLLLNCEVLEWNRAFSSFSNVIGIVSEITLVLFFYTLYNKQK